MKFEYKKEINVSVGQMLYGIIEVSSYTYDGVYPITVTRINWNEETVVFKIEQPCAYVECPFYQMDKYVFESEKEAEEQYKTLDFGVGLSACY